MKVLILFLSLCCISNLVSARVFRCADSSGKVAYQKTPCENLESAAELNITTGSHRTLIDKRSQAVDRIKADLSRKETLEAENKRKQLARQQLLDQSQEQAKRNQLFIKDNKGFFSPYAIPPYEGNRYQGIVQSFLTRLPEIERYRRIAAAKVLNSGQCQRIEASDLEPNSTLKKLKFQVDCRNSKRISLNEEELQ